MARISWLLVILSVAPGVALAQSAMRDPAKQLKEALAAYGKNLTPVIKANLQPVRPFNPADACRWYVGFDISDVESRLVHERDRLISELGAIPESAALQSYILDEFPVGAAVSNSACAGRAVVVQDELNEADKRVRAFASRVAKVGTKAVERVSFVSTPEKAVFRFAPKAFAVLDESLTTNTTKLKMWRGRYRYRVEKDGYIPIDGEMTIMDGDRLEVRCELVRKPVAPDAGALPTPLPCNVSNLP